jgi:hypothetical protein
VSLAVILSCSTKASKVEIVRSDYAIKALPNGNYEVTKAWITEQYRLEAELRKDLENCRNLLSESTK